MSLFPACVLQVVFLTLRILQDTFIHPAPHYTQHTHQCVHFVDGSSKSREPKWIQAVLLEINQQCILAQRANHFLKFLAYLKNVQAQQCSDVVNRAKQMAGWINQQVLTFSGLGPADRWILMLLLMSFLLRFLCMYIYLLITLNILNHVS